MGFLILEIVMVLEDDMLFDILLLLREWCVRGYVFGVVLLVLEDVMVCLIIFLVSIGVEYFDLLLELYVFVG